MSVDCLSVRRVGFLCIALLCVVLESASAERPNERSSLAINLAGISDWSSEMPMADLFWRAREWVPQAEGKPWGQGVPLSLDSEGWINRLQAGQYATTIVSGGGHPAGRYTCLFEGRGRLRLWGDVQNLREERVGRIVFDSQGRESIFVEVRETDASAPLRDIRIIAPGHLEPYREEPFLKPFLERTGHFRAIRFMDWMATNNSEVRTWPDRPKTTDFSQAIKGVALEHMIKLCNQLKTDPWFCMPHLADNDYIRRFASQVKESLDPSLLIYIEYSNEVWNGQFGQARYALEQGKKLGLSDNAFQAQLFFHSMRSVQVFKIWEEVFGGTERLVRVLGSQAANPWVSEQVMSFQDANRCADALAIAPYFGNELGSPETQEQVSRMSVDEVLERCRQDIQRNQKTIAETVAKAKSLGLEVIAYEAGQHLVGFHGAENNQALEKLFHTANRDPRMGALYTEYLNGWRESGGHLAAIFSSVGEFSKWGSWGILEREAQNLSEAPKYRAVMDFLRTDPAWWPK